MTFHIENGAIVAGANDRHPRHYPIAGYALRFDGSVVNPGIATLPRIGPEEAAALKWYFGQRDVIVPDIFEGDPDVQKAADLARNNG